MHVLEPDPVTARWVEWAFTGRACGRSVASLVRELNERGVPCPSGADPGRNGHRSGQRWIVRTLAMILENPRYTGRQVWNRQHTIGHGTGGRPGGRGSGTVHWSVPGEWAVSESLTHVPLVDDATFLAVQRMRAARATKDGETRCYRLSGLLVCGVCGRRMDAHWVHGRAGYRCRHGYTSAVSRTADAPRNLYLREDDLLAMLPRVLAEAEGRQHGPGRGASPPDPAQQLRDGQLQVVCADHGCQLRQASPSEIVSPSHPQGQMPLDLGWVQAAAHRTWALHPAPNGLVQP